MLRYVSPLSPQVQMGQSVAAEIRKSGMEDVANLCGAGVHLSYDSEILEVGEIQDGYLLADGYSIS